MFASTKIKDSTCAGHAGRDKPGLQQQQQPVQHQPSAVEGLDGWQGRRTASCLVGSLFCEAAMLSTCIIGVWAGVHLMDAA